MHGAKLKMVKYRIGAVVAEFNFDINQMMLELAKSEAKNRDCEVRNNYVDTKIREVQIMKGHLETQYGSISINHEVIAEFIETLEVSESVKEELRVITPWTYTGF